MIKIFHKRAKPLILLVLLSFTIQVSGLQEAFAHCPAHTGQNVGSGEAGAPPAKTDSGNPNENSNESGDIDPVYLNTGEYNYSHQDLFIPSRGQSIEIVRYYKSQKAYNGQYGYGWFMNYNLKLKRLVDNHIFILNGDGRKDEYTYDSENEVYIPPPGVYSDLVKNQDGTYTLTEKHGTQYNFDINGSLASIVDRNNNRITFTYTETKLPIIGPSQYFVNQTTGVIAYEYQLTKVTDTVGREITFTYNENGRLAAITDFTGRKINYTYDAQGNLMTVEDPHGNITQYTYDTEHNLLTITDAKEQTYLMNEYNSADKLVRQTYGGHTSTVSYDEQNNQTTVVDRSGFSTVWTFDEDGNPTRKKEFTSGLRPSYPALFFTFSEYNTNKELTRKTFPAGNRIEYQYDVKGNLLQITRTKPDSTEPPLITTFTYEPNYNFIKTMTDPKGNVTTYDYDIHGNLIKITYPQVGGVSPITQITYTQYGEAETVTDPEGVVTKYEYDLSTGYLTKITSDYGDTTHINAATILSSDAVGNITSLTDARGTLTTFEYDTLNQLTKVIFPAPFHYQSKYTHDQNGNLIKEERQADESGSEWQTIEYEYDILDQLTKIKHYFSDQETIETRFEYDGNGNKTKKIDAEGNKTTYLYDERDLLFKVIDALGNVTEYTYDMNGNPLHVIDARGNITTSYTYDDFDRRQQTLYPDGTYEQYTYDLNSNLISKRTRKGDVLTYAYDSLNRLISKTYPDTKTVDYAYDLASRLASVQNQASRIEYTYNALGRVKQAKSTISVIQKIVSYEYDAGGNRTKLTCPDNTFTTYEYDELNRLAQIKDQTSNPIASYQYDALSRRKQLDYTNNTLTSYQYDMINRITGLTSIANPAAPIAISDFSYTYDKVGNRKTMTTLEGVHNYTYDKLYQLTQVTYPNATSVNYGYDAVGNRITKSNGGTISYSTNNLNQYDQVNGVSYIYDQNGNLISNGINTYEYDYENRLMKANTSSNIIEYLYDPLGRRISKKIFDLSHSLLSETNNIYDEDQIIAEYDGSDNLLRSYINSDKIDQPITLTKYQPAPSAYYYHADGLGSIAAITDSSGNLVERYTYDIYGQPTIKDNDGNPLSVSSIGNEYMFTGRTYDAETGLYYYRARYYDPGLGRFLSPDPIGSLSGDSNLLGYTLDSRDGVLGQISLPKGFFVDGKSPLSLIEAMFPKNLPIGSKIDIILNLYRYVNNNPINYIDSHGLFTPIEILIGITIISIIVLVITIECLYNQAQNKRCKSRTNIDRERKKLDDLSGASSSLG